MFPGLPQRNSGVSAKCVLGDERKGFRSIRTKLLGRDIRLKLYLLRCQDYILPKS